MVIMQQELKPCPFCGEVPELEECIGTYYEYVCSCDMARFSIQICDLMTLEERCNNPFNNKTHKYKKEFIDRAEGLFINQWNTRVSK